MVQPTSYFSTDDSDVDLFATQKPEDSQNEGGIKLYDGKTSHWHRPKRIKGITVLCQI